MLPLALKQRLQSSGLGSIQFWVPTWKLPESSVNQTLVDILVVFQPTGDGHKW
jgi:hypothetical protein